MNISKIKKYKWFVAFTAILLIMVYNTFVGLMNFTGVPKINHYIQWLLVIAGVYIVYKKIINTGG